MAKSKRAARKHRNRRSRRIRSHRGGASPIADNLYGSSASNQSLAQGEDFAQYHQAQHGGSAPLEQAFGTLDPGLRGSAMLNGIDQAIADSAMLRDDTLAQPMEDQSGGHRRRRRRTQKRKGRKSQRSQRRNQRRSQQRRSQRRSQQGGNHQALGYQLVNAPGLLLDNKSDYDHAGLNPDYYTGSSTEQYDATMRDRS